MDHLKNILITGASGLIGTHLTNMLTESKYQVRHLGRSKKAGNVPSFVWNVDQGEMDSAALDSVQAIVHLAGAGVADKRWSNERKKEILDSRVQSTRLLFDTLKAHPNSVETIVSASAIGYYGFDRRAELLTEASPAGNDFLAEVTRQWEDEVDRFMQLGIRVVKIRIGIVLSDKGGALKEMAAPVRLFAGAPLGSGEQLVSWIHINDLCEIFIHALRDPSVIGAYNGVAPNPVTNRQLTKEIGRALKRPVFLPSVPGFVLKGILGEMAEMVLKGSNVSARKILDSGFRFQFTKADAAVQDLLR